MEMPSRPFVGIAAALLLLAPAADLGAESFTATVVPDGHLLPQTFEGRTTGAPLQLTVRVDTWSERRHVQELQGVLQKEGQAALARVLHEAPVGSVVPPAHVSFGARALGVGPWSIVLASVEDTPEGRVALLVTDGSINPFGSPTGPEEQRTAAPHFGALRITLDAAGRGTGELFPLASVRIHADGRLAIAPSTEEALRYQLLAVREWKKQR